MCSSQPVVPTTSGMPIAASLSILPSAAARSRELDRHIGALEVRDSQTFGRRIVELVQLEHDVKPYSGASCSISFPIFP